MGSEWKYIPLHEDTASLLLAVKKRGESYDLLICRLLGIEPKKKELIAEQKPAISDLEE
jgi:hypothetical protein